MMIPAANEDEIKGEHLQEIIPHLFRTEFRKIANVLVKHLGIEHIEIAEDITSDTFLLAVETWPYNGIPDHPVAWLYAVAKNKAKNVITRHHTFENKVGPAVKATFNELIETDIDLSDKNIVDSQLQMLFALCHPVLPHDAQVGLALRLLCGFGIDEIATAYLTNRETIIKRLHRAREKLRSEKIKIEFPPSTELNKRMEPVLQTLYLLFSEGYYSETHDEILRKDLCVEAMRLTYLLIETQETNHPEANALLSLMCFHSSRFEARVGKSGELVLYQDQDESLWNQELIARGIFYMKEAAQGTKLSKFHLEASIAYWHTIKADTQEKWESILQLYNKLLVFQYSPIAALNRTYALSKARGIQVAIGEAEKLNLENNQYYYALLGELYSTVDRSKAITLYKTAMKLAKAAADKNALQKKIEHINNNRS